MNQTWNKAKIEQLLRTNNRAVERAMVALYERQTHGEKRTSDARHTNQRGFSGAHTSKGSYYARWVISGRRLSGFHLSNARGIALHYTTQLLDVARLKSVIAQADAAVFGNVVAKSVDRTGMGANEYKSVGATTGDVDPGSDAEAKTFNKAFDTYVENFDGGPQPGTYAHTARAMFEAGIMSGEEADAWKDEMKEGRYNR